MPLVRKDLLRFKPAVFMPWKTGRATDTLVFTIGVFRCRKTCMVTHSLFVVVFRSWKTGSSTDSLAFTGTPFLSSPWRELQARMSARHRRPALLTFAPHYADIPTFSDICKRNNECPEPSGQNGVHNSRCLCQFAV